MLPDRDFPTGDVKATEAYVFAMEMLTPEEQFRMQKYLALVDMFVPRGLNPVDKEYEIEIAEKKATKLYPEGRSVYERGEFGQSFYVSWTRWKSVY